MLCGEMWTLFDDQEIQTQMVCLRYAAKVIQQFLGSSKEYELMGLYWAVSFVQTRG